MRRPSHRYTPRFTVTRSPTMTSPSMNTPSQMLQSWSIFAPGRTWLNAHTRVPAPTSVASQSAFGCTKWSAIVTTPEHDEAAHEHQGSALRVLERPPDVRAEDAEREHHQS